MFTHTRLFKNHWEKCIVLGVVAILGANNKKAEKETTDNLSLAAWTLPVRVIMRPEVPEMRRMTLAQPAS